MRLKKHLIYEFRPFASSKRCSSPNVEGSMSVKLNTLWVGESLGYMERACLASALAVGHQVALYSYNSVGGVPEGVEVLDARTILSESRMLRYRSNGSVALGSNIFRYELLRRGLGCWIDADVYFVRKLEINDKAYIFGWEDDRFLCSAVLHIPSTSQLLVDLVAFVNADPVVPPWWPYDEQDRQRLRAQQGCALTLEEMPWATAGPKALTYFAKKNNLLMHAAPPAVFYPVPWTSAYELFSPEANVWSAITPETITVHLWNHIVEKQKRSEPRHSSFVADICNLQGVDFRASK
jgi:hypothetical protein